MLHRTITLLTVGALAAVAGWADFTYVEKAQITGGAMAGAMKFAGAFSKEAREPIESTIVVKGNRMARISKHRASITDLDKETITNIDFDKKSYSVMTFAEMKEAMDRAAARAQGKKAEAEDPKVEANFKFDVKETGQSKVISGLQTKEKILTLEMEGTDTKTGNKGSMVMTSDMWLAPDVPGYKEVREFHKRMAAKMVSAGALSGMGGMMMAQPGMAKGMAQMATEASKLNGVPVLQVMRMSGKGDNMPASDGSAAPRQQQAQQPAPTASSVAASAALGRLGLGGLGRRKKQQDTQQDSTPASSEAPAQSAPGALMEMTTELTSFSSGPADPSRFEVPGGFKQVDNEMRRGR